MLYIRMLFLRIVYDGPQKRKKFEVPSIENWLVTSMLALKMMYYIYIYRGRYSWCITFFKLAAF